jgi:hypothetical protein
MPSYLRQDEKKDMALKKAVMPEKACTLFAWGLTHPITLSFVVPGHSLCITVYYLPLSIENIIKKRGDTWFNSNIKSYCSDIIFLFPYFT